MCVCKAIDLNIERFHLWRDDKTTNLLLSFVKLYGTVATSRESTQTNLTRFRAHSTRSASYSKAEVMGISTAEIVYELIGLVVQCFKNATAMILITVKVAQIFSLY